MEKPILFFDMDGVLVDFMSVVKEYHPDIDLLEEHERKPLIKKLCLLPEFYSKMPPYPGAIDSWHTLGQKFDNYILSAPKWQNPFSYIEKRIWCDEYLGESVYKKLILSHNKGILSGFGLIDDRLKYGVDKFKGLHIHFGTDKFPDWEQTTKYLMNYDLTEYLEQQKTLTNS